MPTTLTPPTNPVAEALLLLGRHLINIGDDATQRIADGERVIKLAREIERADERKEGCNHE